MAQAIHWQVPFMSLNGNAYTVNIYEDDYEGDIVELSGAADPFVTEEDTDEDAFAAIRTQSGNLNIVARYETDLEVITTMAGTIRYITLTDADGSIVWHGYIQPQTFSQSWAPMPYEIAIPVESCLSHLANIDYEVQYDYMTIKDVLLNIFANVPNFANFVMQTSEVDVLNSQFNDSVFESEDDEKVTRLGVNADLTPPEQKTDCQEVISNICEFFGLVCRENGTSFLFTYPGSQNGYDVVTDSETTSQNADTKELPQVMSASNNEDYLDGRRFINITESLTNEGSLIDGNVSHYNDTGSSIHYGTYCDFGEVDVAKDYLDQTYVKSYQYTNPASPVLHSHVCLFGGTAATTSACGGNILRVIQAQPYSQVLYDNDDAKSAFGILNHSSIPSGTYVKAIEIATKRALYGKDYSKGLKLVGNLEASTGDEENWTDCSSLYVSVKWGNKYLSYPSSESSVVDPSWVDTEKYIKLSGSKIARGHIKRVDGQTTYYSSINDYMLIPADDSLEGQVTISFFACRDNMYVLVSDLELSAIGDNKTLFDPCVDLSQNCFRSDIGIYSETYERTPLFNSRLNDEQTSAYFMRNEDGDIYAGEPETALLNSLTAWYSRSTKQLTVSVDDTDYSPLDTIVVESENYTIISAARDYIENIVKLQLQLNP